MTTRPWRPIAALEIRPKHYFYPDDDLRRQWLNQRSSVENACLTAIQPSGDFPTPYA